MSARGRKLRNQYAHFTAAWPPGQAPTRDEQLELADRTLSALGLEDHLAVVIAHNDTNHAHWHLVVCKVHPDTGKAASLGRSGLRLSKVAEQWEHEHGGIVIDNRVRPPGSARAPRRVRRRADEPLQAGPWRGDAASEGRAARRRARRCPPARPRPAPAAVRRTAARPRPATSNRWRARRLGASLRRGTADGHAAPQTRTERFLLRLQRRLRKAGASRDRARATAQRLVPRPRRRHGIVRRTWARLAAPVRRPVDRFAARRALDARLAAARLERVLCIQRRLSDAVQTAMDAVLIASSTRAPAAQIDRCYARLERARRRLDRYERSAEPVVRDHDAAVQREARARERQHEREREWQKRERERAEAARGRPQPGRPAAPTPPATAQRRSPPRAAPRPAPSQVPENPATPPAPAHDAGEGADHSRGQDRHWRR